MIEISDLEKPHAVLIRLIDRDDGTKSREERVKVENIESLKEVIENIEDGDELAHPYIKIPRNVLFGGS
ncbi:MAG: hypothetical protein BRC25_01275 [Parcubacteria group bacterium SW_6_46_9]|nr:MAG: hypothetical protein BRC25_01275 [Parcubacteria group bacterium SW_6_46_9]